MKNLMSDKTNRTFHDMSNIYIDDKEVEKCLAKLKNNAAIGPDGVTTNILKKGGPIIIEIISDLTRTSIDEKCVP